MPYKTKNKNAKLPKDARKTSEAHGTTRKKSPTPRRGTYHTDMNDAKAVSK